MRDRLLTRNGPLSMGYAPEQDPTPEPSTIPVSRRGPDTPSGPGHGVESTHPPSPGSDLPSRFISTEQARLSSPFPLKILLGSEPSVGYVTTADELIEERSQFHELRSGPSGKRIHAGIDIWTPVGLTLYCPYPQYEHFILWAGDTDTGGLLVEGVCPALRLSWQLCHASRLSVDRGEVGPFEAIGLTGSTGIKRSDPHTHMTLRTTTAESIAHAIARKVSVKTLKATATLVDPWAPCSESLQMLAKEKKVNYDPTSVQFTVLRD